MISLVVPPALSAGKKIAIYSPSSRTAYDLPHRSARAIRNLQEALGRQVLPLAEVPDAGGYRAHAPQQAAAELHNLFANPEVGLILTAIGGFNSNSILEHLDWDLLAAHPTLMCGYSDASALLLAIHGRLNQLVLHGPSLLPQFGDRGGPFRETVESLRTVLFAGNRPYEFKFAGYWVDPRTDWAEEAPRSVHDKPLNHGAWRVLRSGKGTGKLIGGNIETINALLGTPYTPNFHRCIVFLEATGAEAFLPRFHRALVHLRDAGAFATIQGLIVGRCVEDCAFRGTTLDDVIREVVPRSAFPIIADVDIGHTEPLLTLPIGRVATLDGSTQAPSIRIHPDGQ